MFVCNKFLANSFVWPRNRGETVYYVHIIITSIVVYATVKCATANATPELTEILEICLFCLYLLILCYKNNILGLQNGLLIEVFITAFFTGKICY